MGSHGRFGLSVDGAMGHDLRPLQWKNDVRRRIYRESNGWHLCCAGEPGLREAMTTVHETTVRGQNDWKLHVGVPDAFRMKRDGSACWYLVGSKPRVLIELSNVRDPDHNDWEVASEIP